MIMSCCEPRVQMEKSPYHYPVMYREVLEHLNLNNVRVVVDCTLGLGSLASKLLEKMPADSILIGLDRDERSLNIASQRLSSFGSRVIYFKSDFLNLDDVLGDLKIQKVDAFIFDLGISTYQLSDAQRGFSFLQEGPLDMRMDSDSFFSAYDLVNNLSERELEQIFRKFGEEHYSRRIAASIVQSRRIEPISTTTKLVEIILNSVPGKYAKYRIHPATRAFQALRIAVNRELDVLEKAIDKAVSFLNPQGRIGVISFHSLEDRIVKHAFKRISSIGGLNIVTKKPLQPEDLEISENKPSRSAKLRIAEKVCC